MEVIDIGLSDLEPVKLSFDDATTTSSSTLGSGSGPASSNFGIELLMNDKKRSASMSTNVDLGDVDSLERELNDLSSKSVDLASSSTKTVGGLGSTFGNFFGGFGGGAKAAAAPSNGGISGPDMASDSKVGTATVESMGNTKTWDGFGKLSEVPVEKPKLTEREMRRKKRAMLKKLEEWHEKKYIKHSSHFTMDSPYDEIEDEYESVVEEKRKKDSVKLQGWWFTTIVNSLEYANAMFDPFGLNLDGWGEQISEDLDSYEEIFNELHEKYKGGKLSPEISLLLRVAFSASMVNITNKALSTATPGFNDVIRQSPELMKMFTAATANSMKQSSPGFGFVNSILNPDEQVNTTFGAPPAPLETKSMPPPPRPGSSSVPFAANRPDISMGRGAVFREEAGISLTPGYSSAAAGASSQGPLAQTERPDMRGPQQNMDLQNLLHGLKPRTSSSSSGPPPPPPQTMFENKSPAPSEVNLDVGGDDSLLSVSSLRDGQNGVLPKRTQRRKQRSDKNVVSLDI
jgi:hypothetical protein